MTVVPPLCVLLVGGGGVECVTGCFANIVQQAGTAACKVPKAASIADSASLTSMSFLS